MTGRQTLGLIVLSLLASAAWLVDDLLPVAGSPLAGESFRLLACFALTLCVLAIWRGKIAVASGSQLIQVAIVSLGLVAIPFLLLNFARGRVASTDGLLIFALMPIALMLMAGWVGIEQNRLRSLPSALLGAAGVMILLPVPLPASREEMLGTCLLAAAMLLSAASTIWLHLRLRGVPLAMAIPAICLANGVVLSLTAGESGWIRWEAGVLWPHSLRAGLFDLPQILLLVWLLKTIAPQRLAGRYLIAPLFTVVEGLFLIRPRFDVRTIAGLGLLAASAGMVLFGGRTAEQESVSLNLR